MKSTFNIAGVAVLCAGLFAGQTSAQSSAPRPPTQPFAGIIVTPPVAPPPPSSDTQQSCPDTGHKLELMV
jgi:hypothetical protein